MLKDIKGIVDAIKAVMKGVNIGTGIGIIKDIILDFKPLVTVISKFLSMLSLILSPIQYLVTGLLIPIMLILKPFATLVKQLMLPFFTLAMQAMRLGADAITETGEIGDGLAYLMLGATDLLVGLSTVISALFYALLQEVSSFILEFSLILTQMIFPYLGITEEKIGDVVDAFDALSGTILTNLVDNMITGLANLNEGMGIDTTQFQEDALTTIQELFNGPDGVAEDISGSLKEYTDNMVLAMGEILNENSGSFKETVITKSAEISSAGVAKVNELIASARSKAEAQSRSWFNTFVENVTGG